MEFPSFLSPVRTDHHRICDRPFFRIFTVSLHRWGSTKAQCPPKILGYAPIIANFISVVKGFFKKNLSKNPIWRFCQTFVAILHKPFFSLQQILTFLPRNRLHAFCPLSIILSIPKNCKPFPKIKKEPQGMKPAAVRTFAPR